MISFDKAQMIRDDVVGMSYGVLTATAANGKTVIENLIEKGLVERAVAEQYGLVEATTPVVEPTEEPVVEPTEPAVEPIEEPVATEAEVEFMAAPSQSLALGQSLFEVGKVKVTAADKDVNVTGLKLRRTGLSADTDISTVTVWNGTEKVNSIGRFSNGVANIAFTKSVVVKAGESLELPIKINIVNNATRVGAQLRISLEEVKANANLVGSLEGNVFTLAPAGLGTMVAKVSGDAPTANISAGDKDIRLAKFDISFAREAQVLKQVILTQDGTASDTDLTNLRLVDEDGAVLAEGELNKGEVAFTFEKEYASGSTARLTLKGDVVGGANRTVQFSINNVNDVQSVGKTYGTTIALGGTVVGNSLLIEKGTLILTKDVSSPAAATIAKTVDDQKFTAIKIEAVGEPIQLETVVVGATTTVAGSLNRVKEIKLMKDGLAIASQEFIPGATGGIAVANPLPLNEVVTVEPGNPVVLNILMDVDAATTGDNYTMGIATITGTGLISGKDLTNTDATYGNQMTVGDVKVKVREAAMVDGYIFPNQSEVKLAGLRISHNLGEAVKVSSVTVDLVATAQTGAGAATTPVTATEVTGAGTKADMMNTFKNMKLVGKDGKVVSGVISNPDTPTLTFSLNDGVIVGDGETLELSLVGDVKATAITKADADKQVAAATATITTQAYRFKFNVNTLSAVTVATGTDVDTEEVLATTTTAYKPALTGTRTVEVASAATAKNMNAEYSVDANLKNKNVYEKESVKLAQWTLTNESNEEVRVNKLNLVANYGGQTPTAATAPKNLKHAYVECVLKDGKGNVLSDTFTLENDVPEEITIKTSANKSLLVIPEQKDTTVGEKDIALYATIAEGAQVAGTIDVQLGSLSSTATATIGNIMEITGAVTGQTETIKGANINAGKLANLATATAGAPLVSTVGVSPIYVTSTSLGSAPVAGQQNATVAKFKLKNAGEKTVKLTQVGLELIEDGSGASTTAPAIAKLDIMQDGNKLVAAGVAVTTATSGVPQNLAFKFDAGNEIELVKGEEKEFEVKLGGTGELDAGEMLSFKLERATTLYDTAKLEGYSMSIDVNSKQDDTIKLESKAAVNP